MAKKTVNKARKLQSQVQKQRTDYTKKKVAKIAEKFHKQQDFARRTENYSSTEILKNGVAIWGKSNKLPLELLNLLHTSEYHSTAIRKTKQFMRGTGLTGIGDQPVNNYGQTWNDIWSLIVNDTVNLQGFAIKVIYTNESVLEDTPIEISEIYHIPVHTTRCAERENGVVPGYYRSNEWDKIGKNPDISLDDKTMLFRDERIIEFAPAFNTNNVKALGETSQILRVWAYDDLDTYNPRPSWYSAIRSILSDTKNNAARQAFLDNSILASLVMQIVGEYEDDEWLDFLKDLANQHEGAINAGKPLILNATDGTQLHQITAPNTSSNTKAFDSFTANDKERILTANGVTFPEIIGIQTANPLQGRAVVLEKFYSYINTSIRPDRDMIMGGLKRLLDYLPNVAMFETSEVDPFAGLDAVMPEAPTSPTDEQPNITSS